MLFKKVRTNERFRRCALPPASYRAALLASLSANGDARTAAARACPRAGARASLLLGLGEDLRVALAVWIEAGLFSLGPRFTKRRVGEVPVRAALLRDGPEVAPQLLDRGAPEEPVADVDLVHDQARLEHDRVRHHRVVGRVGVLRDVEIL